MFNDIGNLRFDDMLGRYIHTERWTSEGLGEHLIAWMQAVQFEPHGAQLPKRIAEVRHFERRIEPRAESINESLTLVLGVSPACAEFEMRSTGHLEADEVSIELQFDQSHSQLTIVLLDDLKDSFEVLSTLSMFVNEKALAEVA